MRLQTTSIALNLHRPWCAVCKYCKLQFVCACLLCLYSVSFYSMNLALKVSRSIFFCVWIIDLMFFRDALCYVCIWCPGSVKPPTANTGILSSDLWCFVFYFFFPPLGNLKRKPASSLCYCHLNPGRVILETVVSLLICFFAAGDQQSWIEQVTARSRLLSTVTVATVCRGTKDLVMRVHINSCSNGSSDLKEPLCVCDGASLMVVGGWNRETVITFLWLYVKYDHLIRSTFEFKPRKWKK